MTDDQQIIEFGKLDGWTVFFENGKWILFNRVKQVNTYGFQYETDAWYRFKKYHRGNELLHSRDLLIPIILKYQWDDSFNEKFRLALIKVVFKQDDFPVDVPEWEITKRMLFATARQLAEAFLRAMGKWKD